MKVYLYLDVYILLNFIMNLFLLMITAVVRQKKCRIFRLFLVSLFVSLLSAAVTCFFWGRSGWQLFFAAVQITGLVRMAFTYEGKHAFLGDCLTFLFLTFFAGGCIGVFLHLFSSVWTTKKRIAMGGILTAVIILLILFFLFRFQLAEQGRNRNVLSAKIVHKGKEYDIRVLYDTGNQLFSPYTGENVAVVSETLSEKIGLAHEQNPLLIPYSSIGGSGLLKAYRIEMVFLSDGAIKREVLAAVSENIKRDDEVQMILGRR